MNKLQIWISAARLRTLPLSVSGIIIGNSYAFYQGIFDYGIFVLALLTTVSFQILSNFANDYGDGVKGTDNEQRIGPSRVLQQGLLSRKALKRGIVINVIIAVFLTLTLILKSFSYDQWMNVMLFLLLGVAAIIAAIKYTVGDNAYGYFALGDFFVFIFFGCISVLGSHYLQTQTLSLELILPAIAVGCLSVAVLNLNNMRDAQSDLISQKITVAVHLGFSNAKYYHYCLFIVAIGCSIAFALLYVNGAGLFFPFLLPVSLHLKRVNFIKNPADFDPELKIVALSTFGYAILVGTGIICYVV